MQDEADRVSNLLKCLAHPHRLLLICHLVDGAKSVGELAELIGTRQSSMSQHLSQLRDNEIVATHREAQTVFYEIASPAVRALMDVLYQEFCTLPTKSPPTQPDRKNK